MESENQRANGGCSKLRTEEDESIDFREEVFAKETTEQLQSSARKSARASRDEDEDEKQEEEEEQEGGRGWKKEDEEEKEGSFAIQIEDDVPEEKVSKRQANTYAAKKTVAQGMMDIALITANANQLRYIIEFNRASSTFYLNVILISISLLLQVGVGLSLIFKGRLDLRGQSKHAHAKRINNYVVVGVFLVTIINVFIGSFTITNTNSEKN